MTAQDLLRQIQASGASLELTPGKNVAPARSFKLPAHPSTQNAPTHQQRKEP